MCICMYVCENGRCMCIYMVDVCVSGGCTCKRCMYVYMVDVCVYRGCKVVNIMEVRVHLYISVNGGSKDTFV
jgi:hypothetical protein